MSVLAATAEHTAEESKKDPFERVSEALEVEINKAGNKAMGAAYDGTHSPFAEGQLVVLYRLRWNLLGLEPPEVYSYVKST
jgi:hypothetical protein